MNLRSLRLLLAITAVALATTTGSSAAPFYQGAKVCQECHEAEFPVWEGTKHFQSYRKFHRLDEAKSVIAAFGGDDNPRDNAVCAKCHYSVEQKNAGDDGRVRAGPSCESCHGPASDYKDVHNDFGQHKASNEPAEHKTARLAKARDAGMVHSSMHYDIATNCLGCHGPARADIPPESFAKLLDAKHPISEFELVRYSQGTVRHRFYPPDPTANKKMTPPELARFFVTGQAAALVSASGALTRGAEGSYKALLEKRVAAAKQALGAVKSVPEAATLVQSASDENARKLVAAIASKDLSGEVGGLLPAESSYK